MGLGNPGRQYSLTRHNAGFMVAEELVRRWGLSPARDRFRARIAEGRVGGVEGSSWGGAAEPPVVLRTAGSGEGAGRSAAPTGPGAAGPGAGGAKRVRVAVMCPQTFMNDAGRSVGPARGAYRLPVERVLVVHDEIDLPFGEVRSRLGGGLAGHNGLKSLRRELGSAEFMRVRTGVGRPASTDPEVVSSYVLGRFGEPAEQVRALVERAADEVERIVLGTPPARP